MIVETEELIGSPASVEAAWTGIKEPADSIGDSCRGIEESCKPIVHMGGLVCPRLKMWDAMRWLNKPPIEISDGRRKEVRFWRKEVESKNIYIRQLKEEIKSLKGRLGEERLRHEGQIQELLEEREIYSLEILRLMWDKEELIQELEKLKEERDRLRVEVARYFEEAEGAKSGKRKKEGKEEIIKRKPGAKEGHKGWYRPRPEVIDEVVEEILNQCPHCGCLEIAECNKVTERTEEDIVPVKVKATRYRQHYYWCKGCKRIISKEAEGIKGGQLGENVISLAAEFRHEFGWVVQIRE